MKAIDASTFLYAVEGNQIYCSRGDVVLGYKIDYPEKYSQSKFDFENIHARLIQAFRNLPIGTIVVKSDVYEKKHYNGNLLPDVTYLQKSTKDYFSGREYFDHYGYVFFVFTRINTLKNESIKNPFVLPSLISFDKEDLELQNFISDVEQAVDLIGKDKLIFLKPLNEKEILAFRDFYFNGFQEDYFSELNIEKDHIESDNKYAGIFCINHEKNFPDNVVPAIEDSEFSNREKDFIFYQGFMDVFGMTLGCSHIFNQILFIDDHNTHLNRINTNLTNLKASRRFSPENEIGAKRLEEYVKETIDDPNYRYIRGHNNLIYWTESKAELDYYKKKIAASFKALDFKPTYVIRERLKNIFYNSFFSNVSCLNNENLYLLDLRAACCLFINNSNYKNDEQGVILNDRIFNIPVKYDFWDSARKRKTSRNFAIIAPTGSGKSFTWQHISRQLYEDDVVQIIIDLGDSYLKMSKLYPAEEIVHFKYEEGKSIGINPFALHSGEILSPMKIEEICEFVWTLIKKQNEPTENERTSLRQIVQHYYITEDNYSWPNFYKFIKTNRNSICQLAGIDSVKEKFFDLDEFLHAGKDFVENGTYAALFRDTEDKSHEYIGKKYIFYELNNIADNSIILSIMLQAIHVATHVAIWSDKTKRGIIFYDEFAKQLEFPEILQRVKYQTQAIRKYNGAAGIVLQSLNQLPETPEGKSIIDNIETFIFLQGSDYKTAEERLSLSRHDKSQLNSLSNNFNSSSPYSEIYIKTRSHGNVYRIETSPAVFLAFQTEGDVHETLLKIAERNGGDMIASIQEYMENQKTD